jgi:FMN phosphatase YigB (HAD superfamily)
MGNYKSIIFDVGDTLVNFRHHDYMSDLGFDEETITFLTDNMIFTDFWEDMVRGDKDLDEACEYFCDKYPELKNEITKFWDNIEAIVSEYDYAKPLIMMMKEITLSQYVWN